MTVNRDREALVTAVADAKRVVEEAGLAEDSPLAPTAFRYVLDRFAHQSGSAHERADATPEIRDETDGPLTRIAKWADLSGEQLGDLLVIEDTGVDLDLWSRPLPARKSNRQRLIALLKTALDRIGWDRDVVPASEINTLCSKYDCLDQNLPANLQKTSGYFSRRGGRGSYEYRITHSGLQAARDELRQVANVA